ncbi:GTP-binding protein [Sporomusa acidovorans]|uniref:CobW/HypB/UreG nucleotide-binding domain-containing protein n=1 Tax=Sporomusa acidovorans (strain ATCC 49682 / DSM 3132 / Mol) TaxID=1123286 RepID=A0ABZ3IWV2_SPOA4|nr:GTP-binding protein [Sporomusa acidovorans]OZC23379.1 putative metal chaperone YciC [Sporomusa acidovorans DSM 3132]SDE43546.1 CobW/HypB/UreG, nucleotide-binding domain [Sporomusa acidovorans]
MTTKLILVGGFLGAGKTTLLAKMASMVTDQGKKVGLITNDQASALVDTVLLAQLGDNKDRVTEVSGSCFCCNFPGFKKAVSHLREELAADIIIAEPVGSCTDLSATILQPLKKYAADTLSIAPLSVLVDPKRLSNILDKKTGDLHPSAAYILEKQLDEADIIVINKIDLLTAEALETLKNRTAARWTNTSVFAISAQTGIGVNEWLTEVSTQQKAGTRLAEVDYDVYAEGEAVLGWLNTSLELKGNQMDGDALLQSLLSNLGNRFDAVQASVGHVKALMTAKNKMLVGNITGKKETLQLRGSVGKVDEASLTVNARVEMSPEKLRTIVLEAISTVCKDKIAIKETALNCLQPGRPNPTYRFDAVV